MATKSEGIQRLLQAEQRANVKVAEAKKSKLQRNNYNFIKQFMNVKLV